MKRSRKSWNKSIAKPQDYADRRELKSLYCDFYPDAVLDLSHCPKLEVLSVQTFAGSSLSKIRLRKEAPLDMQFEIRNEDGEDCRHLIEIEYVQ